MRKRPNILWIVTTQWRAQACGYAGDPNVRTPWLDRLAARSVNYAHAVTPHPIGPFARAAMLTAIHSPQNGVGEYFDPLPVGARTVAHEMRDRGYATAWFGKWHLWKRDPDAPLVGDVHAKTIVPPEARGGFEFWEGFESGFLLNDPWLHGSGLPEPVQFPGYQSDVLCRRAVGFLQAKSEPWFCVVSLEAPHPPYADHAPRVNRPDARQLTLAPNIPRGAGAEARARRELAGYYAHIEATDQAIGALVDSLPEDTAVIFTSVHGDMHGAHGLFRKGWPYEESVRVPLLIHAPQLAPATNDAAVSLIDLPSITTSLAEGRAWACPRIRAAISMPSVVKLPRQGDRVWRGVRSSRAKVVFNADGSPWLVFDLESDPLEMKNLAGTRHGDELIASAMNAPPGG